MGWRVRVLPSMATGDLAKQVAIIPPKAIRRLAGNKHPAYMEGLLAKSDHDLAVAAPPATKLAPWCGWTAASMLGSPRRRSTWIGAARGKLSVERQFGERGGDPSGGPRRLGGRRAKRRLLQEPGGSSSAVDRVGG